MANDKKDLSQSDLDMHLDLDIEMDKSAKRRLETSSTTKKTGNTLDYYNDEMSRSEVIKLIKDHEAITAAEKDELKAAASSSDDVDYAYILNLLNESKKTDSVSKDDTAKIVMRKTKYTRAYKTTRISLILLIVMFLLTSSFLINRLAKSNAKITELETNMETLKGKADQYEALSVNYDEQDSVIKQLTKEKEDLEVIILSLTDGQPTSSTSTTNTTTTNDSQSTANDGPTKYIVQKGDSYWRISMKFYNNGSYYKDILAANNITDENKGPFEGDELIIPKK